MDARKVLILGATGGTGQHLVVQALRQGHEVTAFVRNPERLAATDPRLRVMTGPVEDAGALHQAVRGQDVIISALGRGQSFKADGLMARSAQAIVDAMTAQGVRRLIFMSGFGVGRARRTLPLLPWMFAATLLRQIYADKAVAEAIVRSSALDWTIVQPVGLTNAPVTGRYRAGEHVELRGFPTISRADVAICLLTLLTDGASVRKTLVVRRA